MFVGFELRDVHAGSVDLRVRVGGSGPPVLLLHGHPQTHVMWHLVAPQLAEHHTVVAADLPGYGRSGKPPDDDRHASYSKRAMAAAMVTLMSALGWERFAVCGHDRGGRVAYRLALDHPQRVQQLAVLDIVPTAEMWRYARKDGKDFGMTNWHWFFLARPRDLPERVITAAPERFYFARNDSLFASDALQDYLACVRDPATVHAMCEDYRAGASIDEEIDEEDLAAGRRITCPVLVLWASREELGRWFDVLEVWKRWADDVRGRALDAGHFLAEEAPYDVARELLLFLRR